MKLYFAPGACSLSPHIALREAALSFELVRVDLKSKRLQDGTDFLSVNPKGYVPVLELDGGERLTEGPAIVQYIADQAPSRRLAPPNGSMARYRLQEWLNFTTSELHKNFSALFGATIPENYKTIARDRLRQRFSFVDGYLMDRTFLVGDEFSVADGYMFVMIRWCESMQVDIEDFRRVHGLAARIAERPSVVAALQAEERASA